MQRVVKKKKNQKQTEKKKSNTKMITASKICVGQFK